MLAKKKHRRTLSHSRSSRLRLTLGSLRPTAVSASKHGMRGDSGTRAYNKKKIVAITDDSAGAGSNSSVASHVVVGLIVTDRDDYYDALKAQSDTWLKDVPRSSVFVVGPIDNRGGPKRRSGLPRFVPSPCPDREVWCKRLEIIVEAHRLLKSGVDFDWLWSGNEDWYVDVEALVDVFKSVPRGPDDAVVYSPFGCSKHWKYHDDSKGNTLPKPPSWPEEQQCEALKQRGGICGGPGIVFSRKAVDILMRHGADTLFERVLAQPFDWASHPQGDPVLSCAIYSFNGEIDFETIPWKYNHVGDYLEKMRKASSTVGDHIDCPRCRAATVHVIKQQNLSAAELVRQIHGLRMVKTKKESRTTTTDESQSPSQPSEKFKAKSSQMSSEGTTFHKNEPTKYLTYSRYGGRLNNQLFQFVSALQHSVLLNRTLVVPTETSMDEWTGMFEAEALGLWDLSSLNANYHIDWTKAQSHHLDVDETSACRFNDFKRGEQFNVLLTSNSQKWEDCSTLHIGGQHGLLFGGSQHKFCGDPAQQRVAYAIYKHLKPSKHIIDLIPNYGMNPYELAVHSSTHGGMEICFRGNIKTCTGHIHPSLHSEYCDDNKMRANCAIWTDLPSQVQGKAKSALSSKELKFILAHDGAHDWSATYPDGQYVTADNAPFMHKISSTVETDISSLQSKLKSPYAQSIIQNPTKFIDNIDRLSKTLIDLYALVDPTYFVGNIYSTLSLNACLLRGEGRKYESNMCWMLLHPDEEYAVPPLDLKAE